MRFIVGVAVLVCVSVAFASAKEDKKGEDVSGTITFNGKPLPFGTVTFVSKDGKQKIATAIADDGTYKAVLPKGEYSVGIADPVAKKDDKEPKTLPIPAKYKSPDTSSLRIDVTGGKQSVNIALQK